MTLGAKSARTFGAMSLRPDHKALVFLGAVAILGVGVRVTRAASRSTPAPGSQHELDHQMASADSAANAGRASSASRRPLGRGGSGRGRGGRRFDGRSTALSKDSGARWPVPDSEQGTPTPSRKWGAGALDRPGYINGRLDLDVATAAQIDSLPGILPVIAKRIAADRMRRGPFLSLDGLRRVSGIGPTFIKRLDSLVTFSGAFVQGSPRDSLIPPRRAKAKRPGSTRPAALRMRAPPPGPSRL